MAINWLIALKAVPWADVVQAAPGLVKSARKLFNTARSSQPPAAGETAFHDSGTVSERLARIEAALANLDAEQDSSAELIRSLAEQNARVVEAIEVLRTRVRLLLGATAVLIVAFLGLAVWVVTR